MSNGDRQRLIFGDRHTAVAQALLVANEAKLCDGLGSPVSSDAGEQRASKLTARIGLVARDICVEVSAGIGVRPSGPNARICGDEPR